MSCEPMHFYRPIWHAKVIFNSKYHDEMLVRGPSTREIHRAILMSRLRVRAVEELTSQYQREKVVEL